MQAPFSPNAAHRPMPTIVHHQPRKGLRRTWRELAPFFSNERECLAAYLALETAEVLTGVKPANLIRLNDRDQPCGRNIYRQWHAFGTSLLTGSKVQALPLRSSTQNELLLFFSTELLSQRLSEPSVAAFLHQLGYPKPANLMNTLNELQRRFRSGPELPHEIGLFLGYPLKDVAGYMKRSLLPCTACRMWRIYGDPAPSLALSEHFTTCRNRMAERLLVTRNPQTLLCAA